MKNYTTYCTCIMLEYKSQMFAKFNIGEFLNINIFPLTYNNFF